MKEVMSVDMLQLCGHGVRGNISTLNLLILPILFNYFH